MGYLRTYLMKAAANIIPVFLILIFAAKVNWLAAVMLALALTIVAYFIGDIFILPKTGNAIATIADGFLAALFFWIVNYLGISTINTASIIYTAVVVILVEGLFFHPYLKRLVTMDSLGPNFGKIN